MMLAYADDLVILAENHVDLQRKIHFLQVYLERIDLKINISKSKVIEYRKRISKNSHPIKINGELMEYVDNYTYLGITFNRNGSFKVQAENAIANGRKSLNRVKSIIAKAGTLNWDVSLQLYNSIVSPTTVYGAETWGLLYLEEVEKVQVGFFKSLLSLPFCTPGYMVRIEMGLRKLKLKILRMALKWITKIINMDGGRYPRICLKRILRDANNTRVIKKYNYLDQVKTILQEIECAHVLDEQNIDTLNARIIKSIIQKYDSHLFAQDLVRVRGSSFNEMYQELISSDAAEGYLNLEVPFWKKKIICRLRLANTRIFFIYIREGVAKIASGAPCIGCGMEDLTMLHVLTECPCLSGLKHCLDKEEFNIFDLLTPNSPGSIDNVIKYLAEWIKIFGTNDPP